MPTLPHHRITATDPCPQYLTPFSQKVRDLPAGWLIPVVILIVISFPPLFGHELVALLCGVIYGLWEGFLVVAAGTFLGEGELRALPSSSSPRNPGPSVER